ncbi:MAG: glucosamine--fructose-6-phosphate aminotransferase [Chromatiaceae bacterium]
MPRFPHSLRDWNTDSFCQTLRREIADLPDSTLPLDRGISQGGRVDESEMAVTILATRDDEGAVYAKLGVFFAEVVGGCSCGDDPSPENAYCEMQLRIDKTTAEGSFSALPG